MVKRLTLSCLMAAAALGLWLGAGCGPSNELTGAPVPNLPPRTRVTGYPPSSIETGFIVQLHWSGFDPDGRVVKYQWRISDNGTNGISVRDTLTIDPVTGDTLNPWHETTATDSTFMVTADLPGFPGDPTGGNYPRSFQSHTFWVRAVDDKGAVDPTPAHVSFTSTTLLPTVQLDGPSTVASQTTSFANVVPMPTFSFTGADPDFVTGMPTKYRYMWIPAVHQEANICRRSLYNDHIDDLIDFADSNWTAWLRYPSDVDRRRIRIEDESAVTDPDQCWFLAIQVQDTAGAVSIGRAYGRQVANVKIAANNPILRISERYIGRWMVVGAGAPVNEDIAQGQEIQFNWFASAGEYLGRIESYQWGWNVSDVSDPDDPNWAVQPGLSPYHMSTPPGVSFSSGTHILTVKVVDNSNQVSIFRATLSVVRVPAREDQRPTLLIDDIFDGALHWPSNPADGPIVYYGSSAFRDAFWLNVLSGPGGVSGFQSDVDIYEHEVPRIPLTYRRAVQYKTLIWMTQGRDASAYVASQFRPRRTADGDDDQFIWLGPYMRYAGNVLYLGNMAMMNHLAEYGYEMPVIFESRGGSERTGETPQGYRRGFGRQEEAGLSYWVGPTRFPFSSMGISVLDIMTTDRHVQYGTTASLNTFRGVGRCVSMKGVAIDPEFKARYMPAGGVFPDQILTEPRIDWKDQGLAENMLTRDIEQTHWSSDEFYNSDIVGRQDQYSVQEGAAWDCDGLCVFPMFRSISRFNWIRAVFRAADPDSDWPAGFHSTSFLRRAANCGQSVLVEDADGVPRSVETHNQTVGFIAQKAILDKPYPVGDVVFGFDPYRFNNEHMTRVIRWILGRHFDLAMTAGGDTYHR